MSETNPGPLQTTDKLYDYLRSCQKVGLQAGIKHGEVSVEVCTEDVTEDVIRSDGLKKTAFKIIEKMFVWRKLPSGDTQKGDNNYLTFYHNTQCLTLMEMSVGLEFVEDSEHVAGSAKFKREFDGPLNNPETKLRTQNDDYIAIRDYKLLSGSMDYLREQKAYLLITIFNSPIEDKGFHVALYFQIKDEAVKYNCYLVPKESEITIEKVQIKDKDDEVAKHLEHLHFSTTYINPGGDTGTNTN